MELPRLPRPPRRPRRRRHVAPVALPASLDVVSERWWGLSPRLRAVVVGVATIVALALVGRGATSSAWGPPRQVLVLVADLPAGAAVGPADVDRVSWPGDLVPSDAVTELPPDARVRAPTTADSVLTGRHLATGLAGLLGPGEAAVPVALDGLPEILAGDVVDVVTATPDGAGHRAATAARVVAVDATSLWLAVGADRVDAVAAAAASGRITLAVRPVAASG